MKRRFSSKSRIPSSNDRRRAPVDTITAQPNPARLVVSPILIEEEAMFVLPAVHAVCDASSMCRC